MLVTNAIICSSGIPTCFYVETNVTARGHYCQDAICFQCPSGYYGPDAQVCLQCPFAQSTVTGSAQCSTVLKHANSGLLKTYIPWGITKINVQLWGGGGGGDSGLGRNTGYPPSSGGGGGFSSCNITVRSNSYMNVIVGGGAVQNHENRTRRTGGASVTLLAIFQDLQSNLSFLSLTI